MARYQDCTSVIKQLDRRLTDSVLIKSILPGYAALFRHPNNELNYCVYIIPGNPAVTSDDLPRIHEELKNDPFIGKALGDRYKIERMKAGNYSGSIM